MDDSTHEALGGSDEAWVLVLMFVADEWGLQLHHVRKIYEQKLRWQKACEERGVSAHGMRRDEAHLPRYLRKCPGSKGLVLRAKGGGNKDKLLFFCIPW